MARVSKKAFWNEAKTKGLLAVSDQAVQDALLVLYNNQTPTEQQTETTVVDNGKGFGGADAEFGTSLAKQILAGRTLSPKQVTYARRIALRYWGQFAQALNDERAERGLTTEAPALPKGAATPATPASVPSHADKFTWKPGDAYRVADGSAVYDDPLFDEEPAHEAPRPPELFDGDEIVPGELGSLKDLLARCGAAAKIEVANGGNGLAAWNEIVLGSPEWAAYLRVHEEERNAWLRLVEAAAYVPGMIPQPGLVPALASAYRRVELEREDTCRKLGMVEQAPRSASYAARWHERWGTDSKANDRWLASPEYRTWKAGQQAAPVPATYAHLQEVRS